MLSKPLQITPFKSHEVRDGKKMKVDFFTGKPYVEGETICSNNCNAIREMNN